MLMSSPDMTAVIPAPESKDAQGSTPRFKQTPVAKHKGSEEEALAQPGNSRFRIDLGVENGL